MRRLFVIVVIALSVAAPARALAAAPVNPSAPGESAAPAATIPATTIDNSFLDTERDLSECLNNSVELPGCGRTPAQEGDRGGGLQLATFGILTLGIAFIFWRVAKGIKARDAALAARVR